jgi:hypothetical protein
LPIEVISSTEIKLLGLPRGMSRDLYEDTSDNRDDFSAAFERLNDLFCDFVAAQGFNVSVMPDGSKRRFYHGFDLPLPEKPLTSAVEKKLTKQFFDRRVLEAARALPEMATLKALAVKFTYTAKSYSPRDGSILLTFANADQATVFRMVMETEAQTTLAAA